MKFTQMYRLGITFCAVVLALNGCRSFASNEGTPVFGYSDETSSGEKDAGFQLLVFDKKEIYTLFLQTLNRDVVTHRDTCVVMEEGNTILDATELGSAILYLFFSCDLSGVPVLAVSEDQYRLMAELAHNAQSDEMMCGVETPDIIVLGGDGEYMYVKSAFIDFPIRDMNKRRIGVETAFVIDGCEGGFKESMDIFWGMTSWGERTKRVHLENFIKKQMTWHAIHWNACH